jgi:hypothetical protein
MRLTTRQHEILEQCAKRHGFYDHTRHETNILERLWLKGLVIRSVNGTAKWHATQIGASLLSQQDPRCDCQNPEPESGVAGVSEECPIHGVLMGTAPVPHS